MSIERIERYRFDGREFSDLASVKRYIEDKIGAIIDTTPNRLNSRDALAVLDAIIINRAALCVLLSASFVPDDSDFQSPEKSIFTL